MTVLIITKSVFIPLLLLILRNKKSLNFFEIQGFTSFFFS